MTATVATKDKTKTASEIAEKLLADESFTNKLDKAISNSSWCFRYYDRLIEYVAFIYSPRKDYRQRLDDYDAFMKKTNSYDYAIANDHVGKLLAEYLPSLLKEMGIEDIKHWIKRDLLLRHLVNVDLAKALNQAMTKNVAN